MSGVIFLPPFKDLVKIEQKNSEKYILLAKKYEFLKKRGQNVSPPPKPDVISIYPTLSKKYNTKILNSFLEIGQPLIIWDWGYFKGYFICLDTPDNWLRNAIKNGAFF